MEISLLLKQLYRVHAKRLFTPQDTGRIRGVVVSVKDNQPAGAYRNDLHPKSWTRKPTGKLYKTIEKISLGN